MDLSGIKTGTCGFGRAKREEYTALLPVVEIQHAFYDPPEVPTLEKWRSEVPSDFEFTLKAWQIITHEATSPTYRRLKKRPLSNDEAKDAGFFKPTKLVREAMQTTLDCAKALGAKTILFQCPARFLPLPENVLNFKRFFTETERNGSNFAWEPRGKAWEDGMIRDLCDELDLWHCVDPFARNTVTPEKIYFRLHGIPRWRYTYEDSELEELASMTAGSQGYVFFNNMTMKDDALRFQAIQKQIS